MTGTNADGSSQRRSHFHIPSPPWVPFELTLAESAFLHPSSPRNSPVFRPPPVPPSQSFRVTSPRLGQGSNECPLMGQANTKFEKDGMGDSVG
jgi:hypothetical protein